jgi:hypothetical protein
MNQALPERAKFHHMKDGTAEDWQIIMQEAKESARKLPDRGCSTTCACSMATAAASPSIA